MSRRPKRTVVYTRDGPKSIPSDRRAGHKDAHPIVVRTVEATAVKYVLQFPRNRRSWLIEELACLVTGFLTVDG